MSNGSNPAYPNELASPTNVGYLSTTGLTKREIFAAMAMQGLLASGWDHAGVPMEGAETAVAYADHLLAELEGLS